MRSALSFQASTVPSRSLARIASSDDSTIAARMRSASRCGLKRLLNGVSAYLSPPVAAKLVRVGTRRLVRRLASPVLHSFRMHPLPAPSLPGLDDVESHRVVLR